MFFSTGMKKARSGAVEARGRLCRFISNESGTVSVDWALLAAVCAGLGYGVTQTVGDGARELAEKLQARYAYLSVEVVYPDDDPYNRTRDRNTTTLVAEVGVSTDPLNGALELSFSR